jgi:hypothetical protein
MTFEKFAETDWSESRTNSITSSSRTEEEKLRNDSYGATTLRIMTLRIKTFKITKNAPFSTTTFSIMAERCDAECQKYAPLAE